jgi:hypothetical protein
MMSYDLLWPVNKRLDAGMPEAKVVEEVGGTLKNGSSMFFVVVVVTRFSRISN